MLNIVLLFSEYLLFYLIRCCYILLLKFGELIFKVLVVLPSNGMGEHRFNRCIN